MERLRPVCPKARGRGRVDDRQVPGGIIHVRRNGLMWKDAPAAYGRPKTLYNRWKRWSRMGVFARVLLELAATSQETGTVMIDVEPVVRHWSGDRWGGHLKARRTAASPRGRKGASGRGAAG